MTHGPGDPRFFERSGPHSLALIAVAAGAAAPARDPLIAGVASLQEAREDQISFLDNPRYLGVLADTRAGAVVVHPDLQARVPVGAVALLTPKVYEVWARITALFHPPPPPEAGIHPLASVDPRAIVHPTAAIAAFVTVGAEAEIGPRCCIESGAAIGRGVVLAADCRIGASVSISHAILGARVCIHPGARIGQEGFSFARTEAGFLSMPQLGQVVIGDDVEIGANTTIDRGSLRDTIIGDGTRIDNLVQIGHNVQLGRYCVVVAQVGIAGSVTLGDYVQLGGQAAIAGHLAIGRGAAIGAQAGVIGDVAAGARMLGSPAQPVGLFFRQVALLKRMAQRAGKPAGEKDVAPIS